MQYEVLLYETEAGHCPMLEFLEELRRRDIVLHQRLVKQLEKISDSQYHREPFSRSVGDGLFELRVLGIQAVRALYCFRQEGRVLVLHAFRKRARKLPSHERQVALARLRDHERRFGDA